MVVMHEDGMGRDSGPLNTTFELHCSTLHDIPSSTSLNGDEKVVEINLKDDGSSKTLLITHQDVVIACISLVHRDQLWKSPNESVYMLASPPTPRQLSSSPPPTYVLRPSTPLASKTMKHLHALLTENRSSAANGQESCVLVSSTTFHNAVIPAAAGITLNGDEDNSIHDANPSPFTARTDKGSADLYFHYYGMLQHQQNMLADYIRTGTYYAAIMENVADFAGKAVMDVGCGSGILSLFAAQAGARVVYAVEASDMATFARRLADANPSLGSRIKVLHGKVEDIVVPEKVDVLVSEPMGTMLLNERMIESYIFARDKHLKPGGKMYPHLGRIHLSAFTDEALHAEVAYKSSFWEQPNFYGVDITSLQCPATRGYFSQVVVDQIPPNTLVSNCVSKTFDFSSCTEEELVVVDIPLSLQMAMPCVVHGIASWFDVLFDGTTTQRWLSTAPGLPITHWFQLRCVLEKPLVVQRAGETISGRMKMVAHSRQSYDIHISLTAAPLVPGGPAQTSSGKFDLKEPYYRQLVTGIQWYPETTATDTTTDAVETTAQPSIIATTVVDALGASGNGSGNGHGGSGDTTNTKTNNAIGFESGQNGNAMLS